MKQHEQFGLLIGTLFLARDLTHRRHLVCKGIGADSEHRALAEFYDAIVDLADSLAEAYIGLYNVDLDIPLVSHDKQMDMVELLSSQREWIPSSL